MHRSSPFLHVLTAVVLGLSGVCGTVLAQPDEAAAQDIQNRVLWQLDFAPSLSADQKSLIQSTMMNTLSRAKERHFVGENILTNKIKKEGLNFPECFTEGQPCSAGGAFVLDVHNVDAYAKAMFSYENNEWSVELKLYRNLSAAAVEIHRTGSSLPDLLQTVVSSLFELEAGIEITSSVPDVQIFIHQKLVGTTPMVMKLPAGAQNVTFKKAGYVSETWEFNAEKGKVYTKNVDLRPEETQLTVLTTVPDAEIWIDDQLWAKSNETHPILPGEHTVEVRSETHHSYSQPYKVYPGSPQTMHVAPLPKSRDPYQVRHDGIKKYRLSASVGYFMSYGELGLKSTKFISSTQTTPIPSATHIQADFHGISMAFNYEAEYWGVTFFRLDIGGTGKNLDFNALEIPQATGATLVGFYPAQIRGHYTFWVMQAEASFGLGLSYLDVNFSKYSHNASLDRVAFSIQFNLGLKYFFSEETFAMLSYDLQADVTAASLPRHGLTIGVGMQIPAWMRSTDEVPELDASMTDTEAEAVPTEDAIIESEIDELAQEAAEASHTEFNFSVDALEADMQEVLP